MSTAPSLGDPEFSELFSLGRLRKTWRVIRREIRGLEVRDVLDWLDWSVSLDSSLLELQRVVIDGSYTPSPPTRYEVGKAKGSYRVITALNIRDALVYRHLSEDAYQKSLRFKIPGAYFSWRQHSSPVGKTLSLTEDFYYRSFEVWLRYNEYRTRTMLSGIYEVLVVTDIANYFDSISHDILLEYLAPLGLPRKAVALLGRMLEAFKPPTGHSPNPRIGLPVDELDCSRALAHIFLFEHDHRIAQVFGEDNYVRWMDDQNIGALNHAHARRIVNSLVHSLSTQRLTLNDGKTHLLTPDEVVVQFQLGPNTELTEFEQRIKVSRRTPLDALRAEFEELWQRIVNGPTVGEGHWDKILKRAYALAILLDSPCLEERTYPDLINLPVLGPRIFQYLALRGRFDLLLSLFINYCASGNNLFEAIEAGFFESLLMLDARMKDAPILRALAGQFATGTYVGQTGKPLGRSSAIIALYWHGASAGEITNLYTQPQAIELPKEVARAWMVCSTVLKPPSLREVQARLFGHPSDDVARMAHFLAELLTGNVTTLGNYKSLKSRWPFVGKYYDARSWLAFDLASRSPNMKLKATLVKDLGLFEKYHRTAQEKRVLSRVKRRLATP